MQKKKGQLSFSKSGKTPNHSRSIWDSTMAWRLIMVQYQQIPFHSGIDLMKPERLNTPTRHNRAATRRVAFCQGPRFLVPKPFAPAYDLTHREREGDKKRKLRCFDRSYATSTARPSLVCWLCPLPERRQQNIPRCILQPIARFSFQVWVRKRKKQPWPGCGSAHLQAQAQKRRAKKKSWDDPFPLGLMASPINAS